MSGALTNAVKGSPYCALVRHTRVEARRGRGELIHVRHARVLETFRGPALKTVTYTITTEPDESTEFPKEPVIVTLCGHGDRLYWPGVGSTFPGDEGARDIARSAAASVDAHQTVFSSCE
jgi:hypothetical protein